VLTHALPVHQRGKALDYSDVQKAPGVRRDMAVAQEKSTNVQPYTHIARFQTALDRRQ
jgi:hypothetical protein